METVPQILHRKTFVHRHSGRSGRRGTRLEKAGVLHNPCSRLPGRRETREMPHGEYGDVHRTIVQTFMSKKVMPEKEALELVRSSARYCSCSCPLLSLFSSFPQRGLPAEQSSAADEYNTPARYHAQEISRLPGRRAAESQRTHVSDSRRNVSSSLSPC